MKILLAGNPNVGKSVVFSRLTGAKVITSNYPGTTVALAKGYMQYQGETVEVIDLPGTYSLRGSGIDEQVAMEMFAGMGDDDVVVDVIDATNLERNLNLTFQLFEQNIPVIIALNMWDETKHQGISIDVAKLEKLLDVPVVSTSAISGKGILQLINRIPEVRNKYIAPLSTHERWGRIGDIISQVQVLGYKHHTFLERLDELSLKPLTGIPIAIGVIWIIFKVVRFIGEGLINYVFDPAFQELYRPAMAKLSVLLGESGIIHNIIIGKLIEGSIDFEQSFGLLTTGLYVPFAMVLPYVVAFYLMLGLLEDFGYLPRLSILSDNFMHKLGLHGQAIIPMILGFGCAVPGMLATRPLKTKRERFIAITLIAIAIPCASQSAMIFNLVGRYGTQYVAIVYGTLAVLWIFFGYILNKIMKGLSPELLMEIPPYRLPSASMILKKLRMRVTFFVREAIPYMLLGILLINFLYAMGVIAYLGEIIAPVVTELMGLPQEVVTALLMGFLRKDIAIGVLGPMGLTAEQMTIAATVLTIYFPCIAAFAIMFKELGLKSMLKSTAIMISLAIIVGTLMNLIM
ncbi:MAG: ferrous iron transporter B [Bacteroidales bacterium]|nr:ferrous iron transporter B [Bacteroidales bacterium]